METECQIFEAINFLAYLISKYLRVRPVILFTWFNLKNLKKILTYLKDDMAQKIKNKYFNMLNKSDANRQRYLYQSFWVFNDFTSSNNNVKDAFASRSSELDSWYATKITQCLISLILIQSNNMEFIIIIFLLIYSTTWLFYEKPYSKICVKLEKDWLLFYDVNLKPFLEKSFPHL